MPAGPAPRAATRPGGGGEGGGMGASPVVGQTVVSATVVENCSGRFCPVKGAREDGAVDGDLEVRPPKQRRSREAWNRVLDAGVALLEDGGYDAFTIAAVCERAQVAPTALYARTTSKDALFLAVYEHGIARLRAEQQVFADPTHWSGLAPAALVREGVAQVVGISLRHRRYLRAVVLVSGVHPEVQARGGRYVHELAG